MFNNDHPKENIKSGLCKVVIFSKLNQSKI